MLDGTPIIRWFYTNKSTSRILEARVDGKLSAVNVWRRILGESLDWIRRDEISFERKFTIAVISL